MVHQNFLTPKVLEKFSKKTKLADPPLAKLIKFAKIPEPMKIFFLIFLFSKIIILVHRSIGPRCLIKIFYYFPEGFGQNQKDLEKFLK